MPTVAIIDDHAVFRAGLRALLLQEPGLEVVAEAAEASAALNAVDRTHPDVVVLDVGMPGPGGIAIGRELVRRSRARLLALSMYSDTDRVADAFGAGFLGYATKSQPAPEVVDAIRTVAQGRRYLAPSLPPSLLEPAPALPPGHAAGPLRALTAREREIFDLTIRGLSTQAIGQQLGISHRTVETHRSRILHKLRARTAADLVRMAARFGLLES